MEPVIIQSEQVDKLYAALHAIQAAGIVVIESAFNKQTKSKYAELDAIQTKIRPILAAQGLFYIQNVGPIRQLDKEVAQSVTTRICHTSGQWVEGTGEVLIQIINTNGGGRLSASWASTSAATYAKRYSLVAMLGIVTGDDDDAMRTSAAASSDVRTGSTPEQRRVALTGEIADFVDGRWKESEGPDRRRLGDYTDIELRTLVRGLIEEKTDLVGARAMLADWVEARLKVLGEALAPALEARGWMDSNNPDDWTLAEWRTATQVLMQHPKNPQP